MIVKLNLQVQLSHPWSWLCMGSLARNSDKYCMTSGAYIHALLVWSTSAVLKGKLCPVGGRGLGDVRTYFSKHFLALYYKVGGGAISYTPKGMFIYQYSNCSAWTVYNAVRVHEQFYTDACDVTLSVYPHRASLKNMPDHGGNRTYDLWNTSTLHRHRKIMIIIR
jgi:hypothetical protein